MFAIKLLPSAKNEIVNAYKWYEEKSIGLGSKFMESLFDELKFINNPLIEPRKIYLDFHRNSLRKFPYYIYYRKEVDKQLIIIFAVLHKKQDSSEFYKRV